MNSDITPLIEESIKIELNVSDIYLIFHTLFPDDADFWWELVLEEQNHAALLRSGKDYFEPVHQFPHNLLDENLREIKAANNKLFTLHEKFKKNPPSRKEAFNAALNIEISAGELHFQKFMDKTSSSRIEEIFRILNKDDKEHAARISDYMKQHGISINPDG